MHTNVRFPVHPKPTRYRFIYAIYAFNQYQYQRGTVRHRHCSWVAGEFAIAMVLWWIVHQVMTHSNSNIHQYQRTSCSSKANTIPFHIYTQYMYSINISAEPCVMVHRTSSNVMAYWNSNIHQYQRTLCSSKANMIPFHDISNICIQSTSTLAQSRVAYATAVVACLNSRQVCNYDGVIVHRTPSNDTFKFQRAPMHTNVLWAVHPKPTRYRSIYIRNICIQLTSARSRVSWCIVRQVM